MTENLLTTNDWGTLYVKRAVNSATLNKVIEWGNAQKIPYSKYSIKESDMRIKTATFSSPQFLDLTTGMFFIRIVSRYHENFAGIIIDVDFDENKGMYDYQCQDFSRMYMSNVETICNKVNIYKLLANLITHGKISTKKAFSRKGYERVLSGLKALPLYEQSLYTGNIYKGNPLNQNISLIARDKPIIEVIRNIIFSRLGYFDVWFNDKGILQIEPLSKKDWENTGLHLTNNEFGSRKFKFSTANAITGVIVNGTDAKTGKTFSSKALTNLNLSAFFGNITTSISNPVKSTTTSTSKNTKTTTSTSTNTKSNVYGTKNKEVWVNMDKAGSPSTDRNYINKVCELLKKNGWKVHNLGVGANIHTDPSEFSKCKNGIWFTIDNGLDPGTIRHLGYDSWCAGSIMKKGGRCVFACMMNNTKKYWIEKGCGNFTDLHEAWDDKYSGGGDTYLKYPAGYMAWAGLPFMTAKNYDASGMVAQFLKGGCSQEALKLSNWKNRKGNYYVRSGWSSNY